MKLKKIIKNWSSIVNNIDNIDQHNLDHVFRIYGKEVNDIAEMFKHKQYDFEQRKRNLAHIHECKSFISERNDYVAIKKGVDAIALANAIYQSTTNYIVGIIKDTNPLYDITIRSDQSADGHLVLEFDTFLYPVSLMQIFEKHLETSEYTATISIVNHPVKGRTILRLDLKSDDIYKALYQLIYTVNGSLMQYVEEELSNTEDAEVRADAMKRWLDQFRLEDEIVSELEYGNKEWVVKIFESNRNLTRLIRLELDRRTIK